MGQVTGRSADNIPSLAIRLAHSAILHIMIFVFSRDECRESYKALLKDSSQALSLADLKLIVNKYILDASAGEYGNSDVEDLATRGMTKIEMDNLRSVIKGARCRQEMHLAFKYAKLYLAYDEKYEEDMKFFFKLNE